MFALLWLSVGITALFLVGSKSTALATRFTNPVISKQWIYQSITLVIALGLVFLNRITAGTSRDYLHPGELTAQSKMLDWLGFEGSNWSEIGIVFTFIPLVVTIVVVYMQVLSKKRWNLLVLLKAVALAIPLAVMNSLTEELIFRIIPTEALPFTATGIAIVCSVAFGIPHYFGTPGKLIGVLMAGFLGYVAACSVVETQGIGWAWLIHFVQDVPIIAMLLI